MAELDDTTLVIPDGVYIEEDLDNLPGNLKIFTLPVTTSLINCSINIVNIAKYFPLNPNDIVTIQSDSGVRSLIPTKKQLKNSDIITIFMNQITLIMIIYETAELVTTKFVNIKLFDNNSIQITGLKSIFQCNYSINKLIKLLSGRFGVFVDENGNPICSVNGSIPSNVRNIKFKKIRFITPEIGENIYIKTIKISTINISCMYESKINQTQLFFKMKQLKLDKKIDETTNIAFQSDIISAVSIWLMHPDGNNITIFVFESGKISLMACKNREHVEYAYNFIMNILKDHHMHIIKKDLVKIVMKDEELKKYIDIDSLKKVSDLY